jgi:hypothetical protein
VEGFAPRGLVENLDEPAAREALLALLAPFEQKAAGEQVGDDDSAAAKVRARGPPRTRRVFF